MGMKPVAPLGSAETQAEKAPPASSPVDKPEQLKPKWSKIKPAGSAQSPLLGAAMFTPAVLYILLLIGAPFVLQCFTPSATRASEALKRILWV